MMQPLPAEIVCALVGGPKDGDVMTLNFKELPRTEMYPATVALHGLQAGTVFYFRRAVSSDKARLYSLAHPEGAAFYDYAYSTVDADADVDLTHPSWLDFALGATSE